MVGANLSGSGVDDPDAYFFEHYACGSERNYTNYCNSVPNRGRPLSSQTATLADAAAPTLRGAPRARRCRASRGRSLHDPICRPSSFAPSNEVGPSICALTNEIEEPNANSPPYSGRRGYSGTLNKL